MPSEEKNALSLHAKPSTTEDQETEGSLVVIVVDVNTKQGYLNEQEGVFTHCMNSLIAFANTHLNLSAANKLLVIACSSLESRFIYTRHCHGSEPNRPEHGQYELFMDVETSIRDGIRRLVNDQLNVPTCEYSILAGGLSMAICYINRVIRELKPAEKLNSRILIVTGSPDNISQYMNYMNGFFTAQKQSIVLDTCVIGTDSGLLQQGADLTGGMYLKIPRIDGLLQYLLWAYLPAPPLRKKLVLPPSPKVDYRAACACHNVLTDMGFVCSVCLSIFCRYTPTCSTCGSIYKMPNTLPVMKSRKKKQRS